MPARNNSLGSGSIAKVRAKKTTTVKKNMPPVVEPTGSTAIQTKIGLNCKLDAGNVEIQSQQLKDEVALQDVKARGLMGYGYGKITHNSFEFGFSNNRSLNEAEVTSIKKSIYENGPLTHRHPIPLLFSTDASQYPLKLKFTTVLTPQLRPKPLSGRHRKFAIEELKGDYTKEKEGADAKLKQYEENPADDISQEVIDDLRKKVKEMERRLVQIEYHILLSKNEKLHTYKATAEEETAGCARMLIEYERTLCQDKINTKKMIEEALIAKAAMLKEDIANSNASQLLTVHAMRRFYTFVSRVRYYQSISWWTQKWWTDVYKDVYGGAFEAILRSMSDVMEMACLSSMFLSKEELRTITVLLEQNKKHGRHSVALKSIPDGEEFEGYRILKRAIEKSREEIRVFDIEREHRFEMLWAPDVLTAMDNVYIVNYGSTAVELQGVDTTFNAGVQSIKQAYAEAILAGLRKKWSEFQFDSGSADGIAISQGLERLQYLLDPDLDPLVLPLPTNRSLYNILSQLKGVKESIAEVCTWIEPCINMGVNTSNKPDRLRDPCVIVQELWRYVFSQRKGALVQMMEVITRSESFVSRYHDVQRKTVNSAYLKATKAAVQDRAGTEGDDKGEVNAGERGKKDDPKAIDEVFAGDWEDKNIDIVGYIQQVASILSKAMKRSTISKGPWTDGDALTPVQKAQNPVLHMLDRSALDWKHVTNNSKAKESKIFIAQALYCLHSYRYMTPRLLHIPAVKRLRDKIGNLLGKSVQGRIVIGDHHRMELEGIVESSWQWWDEPFIAEWTNRASQVEKWASSERMSGVGGKKSRARKGGMVEGAAGGVVEGASKRQKPESGSRTQRKRASIGESAAASMMETNANSTVKSAGVVQSEVTDIDMDLTMGPVPAEESNGVDMSAISAAYDDAKRALENLMTKSCFSATLEGTPSSGAPVPYEVYSAMEHLKWATEMNISRALAREQGKIFKASIPDHRISVTLPKWTDEHIVNLPGDVMVPGYFGYNFTKDFNKSDCAYWTDVLNARSSVGGGPDGRVDASFLPSSQLESILSGPNSSGRVAAHLAQHDEQPMDVEIDVRNTNVEEPVNKEAHEKKSSGTKRPAIIRGIVFTITTPRVRPAKATIQTAAKSKAKKPVNFLTESQLKGQLGDVNLEYTHAVGPSPSSTLSNPSLTPSMIMTQPYLNTPEVSALPVERKTKKDKSRYHSPDDDRVPNKRPQGCLLHAESSESTRRISTRVPKPTAKVMSSTRGRPSG
ncbi:hypothetical protein EW146_g5588 [Bondarzewia mesenterica]|uniref:Uncharacterized protein n=1 Tax=Bondarzewia mesenterica TaxID=1095465 RepID=A0A4S4LWR9_9AGAM|nr:hypothetical protein EW146_g5588 [Bondarzewia mesenterica]